jgi:hypothetical protein
MIKIDYYGGSHGNFLAYILNRYIFKIPSANFNPINALGASHYKTSEYEIKKIVFAEHYSFRPEPKNVNFSMPGKDDTVIQIQIDSDNLYTVFYNAIVRGGNFGLDIKTPEKDTLKKLDELIEKSNSHKTSDYKYSAFKNQIIKDHGVQINYPRSIIRNYYYANLYESDFFLIPANNFLNYDVKEKLTFPVNSFMSFDLFVRELEKISIKLINQPFHLESSLNEIYNEFSEKNSGLISSNKCNIILEHILAGHDFEFNANILEEACINYNITQKFDIHSGIDCFSDSYPTNTKIIYDQIMEKIK